MRLRFWPDTTAADWIVLPDTPAVDVVHFGPAGLPAYARLRFIPDPTADGQEEADAEVPENHPTELDQTRRALHRLAGFTSTPQECYFCVWEGYSDIPLPADAPMVDLPHRRYALLRGTVHDIDAWATDLGDGLPIAPPAFVWPTDHRWCFASDVDPHWAGIGADQAAVAALLADPQLDVVPADPARPQPHYY